MISYFTYFLIKFYFYGTRPLLLVPGYSGADPGDLVCDFCFQFEKEKEIKRYNNFAFNLKKKLKDVTIKENCR